MQIKIFTTGGSIDKYYSTADSDFIVGEPQAGEILRAAGVTLDYEIESLLRKDSLEITPQDREAIVAAVRAAPQGHILITHGTDTMAETGRSLAGTPGKVIVLTGAMQPAAFKHSDAPFNVGAAFAALQTLPEGVYLAMNGRLFDPFQVRKNTAADRFEEFI